LSLHLRFPICPHKCAATLVVGPQLQVTCAIPWLDRFRPKRMVLWLVLTGALL